MSATIDFVGAQSCCAQGSRSLFKGRLARLGVGAARLRPYVVLGMALPLSVFAQSPFKTVGPAAGADFRTVQEAIDAVPADNAAQKIIQLQPGAYFGHTVLNKPFVTLRGSARPRRSPTTSGRRSRVRTASRSAGGAPRRCTSRRPGTTVSLKTSRSRTRTARACRPRRWASRATGSFSGAAASPWLAGYDQGRSRAPVVRRLFHLRPRRFHLRVGYGLLRAVRDLLPRPRLHRRAEHEGGRRRPGVLRLQGDVHLR